MRKNVNESAPQVSGKCVAENPSKIITFFPRIVESDTLLGEAFYIMTSSAHFPPLSNPAMNSTAEWF